MRSKTSGKPAFCPCRKKPTPTGTRTCGATTPVPSPPGSWLRPWAARSQRTGLRRTLRRRGRARCPDRGERQQERLWGWTGDSAPLVTEEPSFWATLTVYASPSAHLPLPRSRALQVLLWTGRFTVELFLFFCFSTSSSATSKDGDAAELQKLQILTFKFRDFIP